MATSAQSLDQLTYLADADVEALVARRTVERGNQQYEEADAIYHQLLRQGILVEDRRGAASRWTRLAVPMVRSQGHCMCWMRRRDEFCGKMVSGRDDFFCAEHRKVNEGRVPCPLDPKHSVALPKLAGHLRFCQRNSIDMQSSQRVLKPKGAKTEELEELCPLAQKILTALWQIGALQCEDAPREDPDPQSVIGSAVGVAFGEGAAPWGHRSVGLRLHPAELLSPDACASMKHASGKGSSARKSGAKNGQRHMVQYASIAGHLDHAGMVPIGERCRGHDQICLLEFGAGTGHLSAFINKVARNPVALHILVDRQAVRGMADSALSAASGHTNSVEQAGVECPTCSLSVVERIQRDLSDFSVDDVFAAMSRHEELGGIRSLSLVATAKHLCGAATDLCLRGLVDIDCALVTAKAPRVRGFAFAVCCHHACEWYTYVGQMWLEGLGITRTDFEIMRWFSKLAPQYQVCREAQTAAAHAAAARTQLGLLSKRLLDEGRLVWLRNNGWEGRLVRFVDRAVTPENVLLLGWPQSHSQ